MSLAGERGNQVFDVDEVPRLIIGEDPRRFYLCLTNHDTVDSLCVGGPKVTFANGTLLEPGVEKEYIGKQANAAVYTVCDTGITLISMLRAEWVAEP
jgi:hypothetical protein